MNVSLIKSNKGTNASLMSVLGGGLFFFFGGGGHDFNIEMPTYIPILKGSSAQYIPISDGDIIFK